MLWSMAPESSAPATPSAREHMPALDGVRGLAILMILVHHLLWANDFSSSPLIEAVLTIRDLLWVGVTLFFSLSGFLITGILYDTVGNENYFSSFFARRSLRIFPLYYGVLIVLLLLTKPLHFDWNGQAYRLLTYTPNLPFTNEWSAVPSPYVNLRHFWSLAVEEQFYLIWPFVVFWLATRRRILIGAVLGALLALGFRTGLALAGFGPQEHTLPGCMDALLIGGALALIARSSMRQRALDWGMPLFLVATAVTLTEAFTHRNTFTWQTNTYLTTIGMTVIALGASGLIAASLKDRSIAQRVFRSAPLRFLGRYSYGLYVYHNILNSWLTDRFRDFLNSRGCPRIVTVVVVGTLISGLSIVVAMLSFHLYEKHFLRLKRFFPSTANRARRSPKASLASQ
jgi:peptidoglycan/LPS O-acetylase OafA/YrhL